ncbi:1,2-phenylacetyl-CoA epoxidase subunit PaaC [Natronobiforma cellulositropha]|uniref:1,2-phenylacetyl-CoA epoxidase subunit PaaC n=1 Tax=Natronobiforma cellulositropha TaxID=1679076 RepID=UPI0021D57CE0|nr:1,2-phenylacetyl-CoA epoxidase subunit PaaC [Natronobiforma cellulositropha]
MSAESITLEELDATERFLLAIADDEFVTGQRFAEWVTVGPTMEEDNVLSSLAQDEMGHARLWYELIDHGRDLDTVGYNRRPSERRNSILLETEHTDFGDTIVINFLYDTAETLVLEAVAETADDAVGSRATKVLEEERYHLEHATQWLERLVSTDEGRRRVTASFERLLPRSADLFAFDAAVGTAPSTAGILSRPTDELRAAWRETVEETISSLPLEVSADALEAAVSEPVTNGRAGEHTDALTALLDSIHAEGLPADHPASGYHA